MTAAVGVEQILWARMSVFEGWSSLKAVEAVCAGEDVGKDHVPNLLSQLLDQSLVSVQGQGEEARYRLPETLRQAAQEHLTARGEVDALRRHTAYYLALAKQAAPQLLRGHGPEGTAWLERLEREQDNLRAALRWLLERGEADRGLRLAGALLDYWIESRRVGEGREWFAALFALSAESPRTAVRANALHDAAVLAEAQGDFAAARQLFEEGLAIYRELGKTGGIAELARHLGAVMFRQHDFTAARRLWEESLVLYRGLGDKFGAARSLNSLGELARSEGDYTRAGVLYEQSLALYQELGGKRGIATVLHNLAYVALNQSKHQEATRLLEKSLALVREWGDKGSIAWRLVGLAAVAGVTGHPERAARLFGAADALVGATRSIMDPVDRVDYDRNVAIVRTQLDEGRFASAWAEGRAMALEQTIEYALEEAAASQTGPN